jgi:hypothetical protein
VSLGPLAAPVVALLGLLVGLWWPGMLSTAVAVLCGYAAGLLAARFDIRVERS